MLTAKSDFAESLLAKTKRFREKMTSAGFTVVGSPEHPICPVMLGDAKFVLCFLIIQSLFLFRLASDFAERMLEQGIYVIGFSFPVVPRGKARIRV